MKAIVTGSEGFIGKALCKRLEGAFSVVRIDTKLGGDAIRIRSLLRKGDIDVVFHLAAETSVFNCRLDDIMREFQSTPLCEGRLHICYVFICQMFMAINVRKLPCILP